MSEEKEEFRVRIPSDIAIKIRIMKIKEGFTFSSIFEEALKYYFEKLQGRERGNI
ncbi:MAG: hypothetical protein J7L31_06575 [Thermoplasmata archaeon]|nr:hypothetical protein [Thermoplasmata archaeon]